jgi:hypothetical protein
MRPWKLKRALKNENQKTNVSVHESPEASNVQSTPEQDTVSYTFEMREDRYAIAYYDHVGDAIQVFLPELVHFFEDQCPANWEDCVISFTIGILGHEDVHRAINWCDVDCNGDQEHEIMKELFRP